MQRFLGSLNYVLDFCPNINRMSKPLHDRLKKNHVAWMDEHTKVVKQIKDAVKEIPCLFLANPALPKEKLLSSAMPIKSWIDIVEEQEQQ